MIQTQLKLRLRPAQERHLERWLWHLTGVWNWAAKKLEADARDRIFVTRYDFHELLTGHSLRMGIPARVLRGVTDTAVLAWKRHRAGLAGRPRLKGRRNRLSSIPFPRPFVRPGGQKIRIEGFGLARFHAQEIPEGRIKCGRIVKRASGWYLCLSSIPRC